MLLAHFDHFSSPNLVDHAITLRPMDRWIQFSRSVGRGLQATCALSLSMLVQVITALRMRRYTFRLVKSESIYGSSFSNSAISRANVLELRFYRAARTAMTFLNNGSSAVDAVEMAVKVLEDKDITNAGFGSNLTINGVVECDATIVDHHGRSGAVGAVGCTELIICRMCDTFS